MLEKNRHENYPESNCLRIDNDTIRLVLPYCVPTFLTWVCATVKLHY